MKVGILITNLGTPSAITKKAIRDYLKEFLTDRNVVSLPRWLWLPLLYSFILTIRPNRSLNLYKKIWTKQGSPLLVGSERLVKQLEQSFTGNPDIKIVLGMRYGTPSLSTALHQLHTEEIDSLLVLPLYPQYSTTTTASTFTKIKELLHDMRWNINTQFISHYAEHSDYVAALADKIRNSWQQNQRSQKLIFSFHGIPKRLSAEGDPYERLCFATADAIASQLALSPQEWLVVFQSRFGREKWLQPYCTDVLRQLPQQGCHSIDIICPGFPIDCLETLEEIAMTNKRIFLQAGGLHYNYIPALNDSDDHVNALQKILVEQLTRVI